MLVYAPQTNIWSYPRTICSLVLEHQWYNIAMNVSCASTETKWLTQLDTKTSRAAAEGSGSISKNLILLSFLGVHYADKHRRENVASVLNITRTTNFSLKFIITVDFLVICYVLWCICSSVCRKCICWDNECL